MPVSMEATAVDRSHIELESSSPESSLPRRRTNPTSKASSSKVESDKFVDECDSLDSDANVADDESEPNANLDQDIRPPDLPAFPILYSFTTADNSGTTIKKSLTYAISGSERVLAATSS